MAKLWAFVTAVVLHAVLIWATDVEFTCQPVNTDITTSCIGCICEASTRCNVSTGCINDFDLCGPFLISKAFWIDAGACTVAGGNANDQNQGVPRPLPVAAHVSEDDEDVSGVHNLRVHNNLAITQQADSGFDARAARQGTPAQAAEPSLDLGSIAAAGERCIDKVVMVEETEYDEHIECHHSYSQRCHTTYTTDFEPQQEEECEENFIKDCFIEYKKVAEEEPVRFCHTPLVCEGEGPEECKTVYESQCETRYHEHEVDDDVVKCDTVQEEKCEDVTQGYTTEQKCTKWPKQVCDTQRQKVKKYSPETDCKKVPRELCGPSGCILTPGPEECFDKKETVVQEIPEENCNLEPQKSCKHVTKLVPQLKPVEECVDIPKEVCSRSRKNPRKVQKPVVKKWCYVPTKQSGLA